MDTSNYNELKSPVVYIEETEQHPLDTASPLSKLFFGWTRKIITLGNKRQLAPDDMWALQESNKVAPLTAQYLKVYHTREKSLLRTFFAIYWKQLIGIAFMQLCSAACDLYGPAYILHEVVTAVQQPTFDATRTALLVLSLYGIQIASALIRAHMTFLNEVIGIQLGASIRSMLFEKALKLNAKSKKEKTAGDIANLFSMDVMNIMNFGRSLNLMWIVPLQVTVVLILIHALVGWAIFVGLGALFGILLLNGVVAVLLGREQEFLFKVKDDRMKVIHEVFGAIQIVKFNAWEEKFLAKVTELRATELQSLWRFVRYVLVLIMFMYSTPVLITITVFATFTLWMHKLLTVAIVFSTLALFKSLQEALIQLPIVIMTAVQCLVSVKRINDVLLMEECDPANVQTPETVTDSSIFAADETVVAIDHAAFHWEETAPLFSDISLRVRRGQFIVVHGAVGQGKSSLCAALLGEMNKTSGSVFVGGSVAYFSQQSWIQNATLRDNILFGKVFDADKYDNVVRACALTKDLADLPAGDRTEIGQKGVNLSGGQKARVSLARACYSDADVYILDSPLSAVDAIVSSEIFTHCFLTLLRNKTIILVTHNPDIIESPHIDRSFLVADGKLVESTPKERRLPSPVSSNVTPLAIRPAFWEHHDQKDSFADFTMSTSSQREIDSKLPGDTTTPTGTLIVEEERAEGRVSLAVVLAYIRAIGGWPSVVLMVFLTLAVEALKVGSDMWLSHWSNQSKTSSPDAFREISNRNLGIYGLLVLGTCVFTFLQVASVLVSGVRGSKNLFAGMLASLLEAPMAFFDTNPIGRLLNRFGDDVLQTDLQIPMTLAPIMVETASALSKIVTTIVITQWMGVCVLPLMAVYYLLGAYFLAPLREVNRIQKTTRSPLLSLVSEGIDGSSTIRAFGNNYLRRFYTVHDDLIERFCAARFVNVATNQWFALRVEIISCSIVFALLMGVVVLHDKISPGNVGLVITYGLSIPLTLAGLVNIWAQLETALISPERLCEYIRVESEGARHSPDEDAAAWPTSGALEFANVSYRYKDTDPLVLRDVSFHIKGGEKIGIVGRTGAGKSSLMMALFRMNGVASGAIRIDGMDISQLGLKKLRSHLAIIPQNPVLFKGTLRNYLDPFQEYSDDDLWLALKKVHLMERISSVPEKLEGPVDENGENYSVGERQMLCMARALLRQAKVVVLDEATAAIDHHTDQLLQRVIREEFAQSTVLTIAHRLDTVLDCDRILVLDHGQLAQCDTPAALVSSGVGIFYELVSEGGYMDRMPSKE